jgi:hypothetical protein
MLNPISDWIPVTEGLPESNGEVCVLDEDSLTPEKVLIFEDGRFYYEAYGVRLDYTEHITHWKFV